MRMNTNEMAVSSQKTTDDIRRSSECSLKGFLQNLKLFVLQLHLEYFRVRLLHHFLIGKWSAVVGALDLNASDRSNHLHPIDNRTIAMESLGEERIIENLFNDGSGVDVQDGTCINKPKPMLVLCWVLKKGAKNQKKILNI